MHVSNLNQEYAHYDRDVRLSNARIASALVIALMPVGALLDWFVYPQFVVTFLKLRIACSVATAVAWFFLQSRYQQQLYPYLIHAWYVFPAFSISWMIAISEGAVSSYYAGLNLVILAVCAVMQTSLKESLFSVGTIFAFYLGACLLHGSIGNWSAIINNSYFLILTAVIVLFGNYNYNRLRYQEFVLRHRLRESQQQLERSNVQLRELDEAKSRFFANISHELRTPLTLIASPIEKLRENGLIRRDAELTQLVSIMEANSLRLLRMINNLLDLVRLEGPQNQITKRPVAVDEMLRGLLISLDHVARNKGVRLESGCELTGALVLLDQDKLEKIILNLLLNAIKFTASGGLVSLTWEISNRNLVFEVKDTGIGIAAADLDHIFDRFWQANTSSVRKYQGVGIGLALVQELTESMGGTVKVESQLEEGTQFTVTLPVEPVSVQDQLPTEKTDLEDAKTSPSDEWLVSLYRRADLFIESEASRPVVDQVSLLRRKRPLVLIGEDQPDMATFIANQLREDFDVLIAADGQYAIDLSRQYKPDLLVLDLMMPEKDGLEVCRALSDEVRARGLPILILTARADNETKLKVLQSGATDFLTKPFSTTELQIRCRNLVALALLSSRVATQNQELRQSLEQIKESEVKMVQHAKMISLGRMSAGLIHEINNPINYVMGAIRLLKRRCTDLSADSFGETFEDIESGLKRVSDLVSGLRSFSHPHPQRFESVNLLKCVEQACRLTSSLSGEAIKSRVSVPEDLNVRGDPLQLSQVFVNLIQNALDACHDRVTGEGIPHIEIEGALTDEGALVKVQDNGIGIPSDVIDKILDPFFTTKEVGRGMGLGLSICHGIIQSHDGHMDIQSEMGRGTTVTVKLPLYFSSQNNPHPAHEGVA